MLFFQGEKVLLVISTFCSAEKAIALHVNLLSIVFCMPTFLISLHTSTSAANGFLIYLFQYSTTDWLIDIEHTCWTRVIAMRCWYVWHWIINCGFITNPIARIAKHFCEFNTCGLYVSQYSQGCCCRRDFTQRFELLWQLQMMVECNISSLSFWNLVWEFFFF